MVLVEKDVGDDAQAIEILDNSGDEHDESVTEDDTLDFRGSLIGVKGQSLEQMYELYCQHAREVGFGVRKHSSRFNSIGQVTQKYYVCSNHGLRQNQDRQPKERIVKLTRTDCKAHIRVKKSNDGMFEVVDHVEEHNHTLTSQEWTHRHRSHRKIGNEKADIIRSMLSSGIRASDSYRYLVEEAGGENLVGHTMKDHLNFAHKVKMSAIEAGDSQSLNEEADIIKSMLSSGIRASDSYRYMAEEAGGEKLVDHSMKDHLNFAHKVKMSAIEAGDAQSLIDMFFQAGVEDEDFFYRFKLDDAGRLSNIFWRDSMMAEDYQIFGDVVVFDTTYRTNKYDLICAPFVGVNNHKKNVMFGCAFINDEKIETFEWLFEVFLKSMKMKCPVTIFTDQDRAITSAIGKVFPTAKHRLCIWHLYQNAVSRFGNLKENKAFNKEFHKCLTGCVDEAEFTECWTSMIEAHGLQENSWFACLYELRDRWCTAYNKSYFYVGILSSQQSGSTNSSLGFKSSMSTNLNEFYKIFKGTVRRWRSIEEVDEFKCSLSKPASRLPLVGMLKHASEVYTQSIFTDFEDALLKSISTTVNVVGEELEMKVYDVEDPDNHTLHRVSFSGLDNFISCTCKRFEEYGLLCCHCLRILDRNSIKEIPSSYMMRRWTKFAKKDLWDKIANARGTAEFDPWRHKMARNYYSLVAKSEVCEEGRRIIEEGYHRMYVEIQALAAVPNLIEDSNPSTSTIRVQEPAKATTKGRKRKGESSVQLNEFVEN